MQMLTVAAIVASVVVGTAPAETTLGAGVRLTTATPIAAITESPQSYVGKTIRVDGVATAVCEMMGCWLSVAPENAPDGKTVRLKVDDGVIVFPMSAKGKRVSAQGVFEAVGADAEAHEAAAEHAAKDAGATRQYQLKATGAIIR